MEWWTDQVSGWLWISFSVESLVEFVRKNNKGNKPSRQPIVIPVHRPWRRKERKRRFVAFNFSQTFTYLLTCVKIKADKSRMLNIASSKTNHFSSSSRTVSKGRRWLFLSELAIPSWLTQHWTAIWYAILLYLKSSTKLLRDTLWFIMLLSSKCTKSGGHRTPCHRLEIVSRGLKENSCKVPFSSHEPWNTLQKFSIGACDPELGSALTDDMIQTYTELYKPWAYGGINDLVERADYRRRVLLLLTSCTGRMALACNNENWMQVSTCMWSRK